MFLPLRGLTAITPPTLHYHKPPRSTSTITSQLITPDETFTSRGFIFHHTPKNLNLDHLNKIFVSVGFPRRDPEKIKVALQHTDSMLWVEYTKTEKPVAFARATGDGVFNAIIWDVVVDPSFQGIGLGKVVMERLIDELASKGIVNIALYSEARVLGFYRALGFVADPDGIKAAEQRTEAVKVKMPKPIIKEKPATIKSAMPCKLKPINNIVIDLDWIIQ
ncbi:hypothetical protein ACFE04_011930 [Oxalis oulophora]